MATLDDLKSLDYGFAGEPFCISVPSGVDLTTLDYGFAGEPFVTGFEVAEESNENHIPMVTFFS